MKQYKTVITFGLPLGIITGVIMIPFFYYKIPVDKLWFLFAVTVPLALLSTAWQIYLHQSYMNSLSLASKEDDYLTHQMRIITLNVPRNFADDLCAGAINEINGAKIINRTRFTNKIIAKTGYKIRYVGFYAKSLTFTNPGEWITFDLVRIDDNHTRVIVKSRPRFFMEIVDYGKNLENIEKIMKFIRKSNPSDNF